MVQSSYPILIHIIFSTKNQTPLIRSEIEKDLDAYL